MGLPLPLPLPLFGLSREMNGIGLLMPPLSLSSGSGNGSGRRLPKKKKKVKEVIYSLSTTTALGTGSNTKTTMESELLLNSLLPRWLEGREVINGSSFSLLLPLLPSLDLIPLERTAMTDTTTTSTTTTDSTIPSSPTSSSWRKVILMVEGITFFYNENFDDGVSMMGDEDGDSYNNTTTPTKNTTGNKKGKGNSNSPSPAAVGKNTKINNNNNSSKNKNNVKNQKKKKKKQQMMMMMEGGGNSPNTPPKSITKMTPTSPSSTSTSRKGETITRNFNNTTGSSSPSPSPLRKEGSGTIRDLYEDEEDDEDSLDDEVDLDDQNYKEEEGERNLEDEEGEDKELGKEEKGKEGRKVKADEEEKNVIGIISRFTNFTRKVKGVQQKESEEEKEVGLPSKMEVINDTHPNTILSKVVLSPSTAYTTIKTFLESHIYLSNHSSLKKNLPSPPSGLLIYGPPGVGKTHLVTSLCSSLRIPVYLPSAGGSIRQRIQKLLKKVESDQDKEGVKVVFLDELETYVPSSPGGERETCLDILLPFLDSLPRRGGGGVVVVGATNWVGGVHSSLRRGGSLDREIEIPVPTTSDRLSHLKHLTSLSSLPISPSVNLQEWAALTNGYVLADLVALVRNATLSCLERGSGSLERGDFQKALEGGGVPSLLRSYQVPLEKTTWSSIGGLGSVKEKLRQCVEWPLKYATTFEKLGLHPPRGILLYGPPGCSKTTLVKAIASQGSLSFFTLNGATLFSSTVGESESLVRSIFQAARGAQPSVLFFDEVDTIVGKRHLSSSSGGGGDVVQERILSTLLNEMDGIETSTGVLVIGATNRPDMIDAALLRPGRFGRVIYVPPPDLEGRFEVLRIYTKGMPLAQDVDLTWLAGRMEGYTGADIKGVCREAVLIKLREGGSEEGGGVERRHFEGAMEEVRGSLGEEVLGQYRGFMGVYGT